MILNVISKIKNLITMFNRAGIANFLTLLTIVLTFCTLLEMKTARFESYKPVITADFLEFWVEWNNKYDFSYMSSESATSSTTPISLNLTNIGHGTAKYVYIEWDKSSLSNLVDKINQIPGYNININNGENFLTVDSISRTLTFKEENYVNYLPADIEKKYEIEIPEIYITLYKIILIEKIDYKPILNLNVEYKDAQNNQYNEKIQLSFNALDVSYPDVLESSDYKGMGWVEIIVLP